MAHTPNHEFKNCPTCPTKAKCRAAGKCLNKRSGTKTMGSKQGGGY